MRIFIDANFLIYLNTLKDEKILRLFKSFLNDILREHSLYTNVLVLDEIVYVSRKKYKVPYMITINFLNKLIPEYIDIAPLTIKEYNKAIEMMKTYNLKPSDAFHAATCITNSIQYIVSEDLDFDRVENIKRIWLK